MTDIDLFASHPDPALRYHRGETATVAAVNPAFARQFDVDTDDLVGEPVEAALAAVGIDADNADVDPDGEEGDSDPDSGEETLNSGEETLNSDEDHLDGDEASTGLSAETALTAADGRGFALRQVGTDDGGYLLLTDVSAAIEQQRALEAENDRLEGFARTVSHDLRNPLEVAQSRLIAARETGDEIHYEKTEAAHARINELVEDVLMLAKSGRAISETESVDLATVVTEAWETVDAPTATLDVDAELGTLTADRERLRTLFENLFRNSVEHAGTDVSISVDSTDEGFSVADDGPGIPPEHREAVFEDGVSTGDGTTGLGLAIVSEIATAHGWTVAATESDSGGAQLEFRFGSA